MLYHVPPAGVTDDLMISSKNVLNKVLFFYQDVGRWTFQQQKKNNQRKSK